MASQGEVKDELLDALQRVAKRAKDEGQSGNALRFAAAANQLSEALAWLTVPNQSHGGFNSGS